MEIFDQLTVIQEIEKHQTPELWIVEARKRSAELKALVNGENFADLLIQQIEKVESNNRSIARKKYSKDIRDLFSRVNKKRENVFQSNGGSEEIKIDSQELKTQFIKTLTHFKGGKSLFKYLSEYFFKQMDIDPNGVIFIEYKAEEGKELKVYPTYKSINDIRHYDANGQKCEYIIFEPKKKIENGNYFQEWRIVDAKTDWTIKQVGTTFVVDLEKTFEHPFGEVPAVILSDYIEIGKRERQNQLTPIVELAKDYARDKSILTIYKFQNGFPKHWQYVRECRTCHGTGKTGKEKCGACDGVGIVQKSDVTDIVNLTLPKEGDPIITPNIAGFIQPDLDTWKQYKVDLADFEKLIDDTLWGTNQVQQSKNTSETATGRFIDVQPVTNELNRLTDTVEWVHNTIANWVANAIVTTKIDKSEDVFHKSYGRRFIIESPDVILEKYEKARVDGSGTTILDKLMQEFILSKYKTDPMMQEKMLKKALVEPYIHYDITTVNSIFGKVEAYKKAIFGTFWETVDIEKTVEELKTEFITYSNSEIAKNGIKPVETVI